MRILRRSYEGRMPRVIIAWGTGWAAQLYLYPASISLGVHLDLRRPLLDLHLWMLTVSIGPSAHITGQRDRQRQSCRGFLFATDPQL